MSKIQTGQPPVLPGDKDVKSLEIIPQPVPIPGAPSATPPVIKPVETREGPPQAQPPVQPPATTPGITPPSTVQGQPAPEGTLADGSAPESKTVPFKRFNSQTQELRSSQAKLKVAEEQLKSLQKKEVFTPGDDVELTPGNVAKMIDSRNDNLENRIAAIVGEQMSGINAAALGMSEQTDVKAAQEMFGERFEEGRDMAEIQKVQEDYPGMNAVDAFRMIDHNRLIAEIDGNAGVRPVTVDGSHTMGNPMRDYTTGVSPEVASAARAFGMDPVDYQKKVNAGVAARNNQGGR